MTKYFIQQNQQSHGPFTIEELKGKGITSSTPVWTEGMAEWRPASSVEELIPIILKTPPPFSAQTSDDHEHLYPSNSKRNKWPIIAGISIVAAVIAIFVFSQNSSSENNSKDASTTDPVKSAVLSESSPDTVTQRHQPYSKRELSEAEKIAASVLHEKNNPSTYISGSVRSWENFVDEFVVEVDLFNIAKHTAYKDIKITISFLSKTGTVLGKENEVVYEYLGAGYSVKRKYKYFAHEATHRAVVEVVNADVAN